MSASPYAQRPIAYHFVCAPLSVTPRMWTSIHVPAGVDAFHDATSSVKPNPVEYHGDVHVPFVTPPCGSAKAWKLTLYCCAADVGATRTSASASASAASVPRITPATLLLRGVCFQSGGMPMDVTDEVAVALRPVTAGHRDVE